ncbi:CRE-LNP-1 protein [Aphelenchoides avenae]|nr:CRE-LNP-1 protein [Aphelenchus avenae]
MGNILRRKKEASVELEGLVKEIKELEQRIRVLVERRRTTVFYIALVMFFVFTSTTAWAWTTRHAKQVRVGICLGALLFSTALFVVLKNVALALLNWRVNTKQSRLEFLQERRRAIIENVKETEKFKVAKEIIAKYGAEEDLIDIGMKSSKEDISSGRKTPVPAENEEKATRTDSVSSVAPPPDPNASAPPQEKNLLVIKPPMNARMPTDPGLLTPVNRGPVRPFVEQSRTPVDRIIDYVMGDGPSNRYALICRNCHSHNGMALREEFEQISYNCFKCNAFNPSRRNSRLPNPRPPRFTGSLLAPGNRPSSAMSNGEKGGAMASDDATDVFLKTPSVADPQSQSEDEAKDDSGGFVRVNQTDVQ